MPRFQVRCLTRDAKHALNPLLFMSLFVGLIVGASGCQRQPAPVDTRPADEAAIRAHSGEWMTAMSKRDLDKTMSFMAADIQARWGGKVENNKEEVRRDVAAAFADPNYALTWQIAKVKVSRSGDLAYEMGTYQETTSDADKKPQTSMGDYTTVWEKQADGTWVATVDIGVLRQ